MNAIANPIANLRQPALALKLSVGFLLLGLTLSFTNQAWGQIACNRTLTADVVAFDMPLMWNRFGPQNINGMMFALKRDVINLDSGKPLTKGGVAEPGRVALRPDKRPRPLVLRMGAGDCLKYTVTNLLGPRNPFKVNDPKDPRGCNTKNPPEPGEVRSGIPFNCEIDDQVADRRVSLRFQGTELVGSIADDGSFVGKNKSSLIDPGKYKTYKIFAGHEGTYPGTSYGATTGGEGLGGQTASGLFAVLNVGPKNAAFYRSQVTREEMDLATTGTTTGGHPIVNYEAVYPATGPWPSEGKAGLPIINMVTAAGEIVHSDINAIVAYGPGLTLSNGGGGLGHFPPSTYPLESAGKRNPTVPNRLEPFREFTIAFHDEVSTKQAFPAWYEDPVLRHTLHSVRDSFMINYGSGGIGTEIISSRLRVGPMHDCVNCAYEEFFLTAFTVSDVGQLVDIPANFGLEDCAPTLAGCEETGPKANYALFPDDPSNVHHSYTGDFTKFRNIHAGPGEQHIFHLHNHQWLWNANDDNSNYLDAQGIGPGSGYTYEINFGGSGNRNKTAGDAIFHCHFYPHFAQGMWEMWRNHDVFEQGTALQATADGGGVHTSFVIDGLGLGDGTPATDARALPDGEIIAGTPIPGVVPLPGKPMAPMPVDGVTVKLNPNTVCLDPMAGLVAKGAGGACPGGTTERHTGSLADVPRVADAEFGLKNPGYPFWIAGMEHSVGQRPPTPPLDMITQTQAAALKGSGDPLWQHPGFDDSGAVHGWDGGLPRYAASGYSAGSTAIVSVAEPRLDLSKELTKIKPNFFPEEGTDLEQAAMAYHAQRNHPSFLSDGVGTTTADFVLNGALPVPGAPYNEPCIDDNGVLLAGTVGHFFDGAGGTSIEGASPFNAVTPRVYKAANVQFDAVFNKLGYHYPQERIITLWQDVVPTVLKQRPPEPFVLRLNTFDCTQYVHSNVVPKTYELDDYQVRTPTDIIGQHIHLPKWDLTTADGAANGWNYEDGTLSPQMVVEIIEAINAYNAAAAPADQVTLDVEGNSVVASDGHNLTTSGTLEPANHPFFGTTQFAAEWVGARSTMQRWFADPVVNVQGVDRGLGIIFTHDHYGPSTHQQIGLYATVLVEPAGSKWVHNETGEPLYSRTGSVASADGGPTSWQAAILTGGDGIGGYTQNVGAEDVESYREFYFEYSDFQHAYQPEIYVGAGPDGFPRDKYVFDEGLEISPGQFLNTATYADIPMLTTTVQPAKLQPDPDSFRDAIQPSVRQQAEPTVTADQFPTDIWVFPPFCPGDDGTGTIAPRPCPEAISADDPGMYVVNYRNESLAARIFDPDRDDCPDDSDPSDGMAEHGGCQAKGRAGDLAFAMHSGTKRVIPELNTEQGKAPATFFDGMCSGGVFCPPINGLPALAGGDPFTPMLRVFEGDRVHVKVQAGGHEEEHTKSFHGLKWLQAGSGFGEAKNSGWRNAQPGGISEQFSFRMPVLPDKNQTGGAADYAYSMNASLDGWVSGTWGILRSYRSEAPGDLYVLPSNPAAKVQIQNAKDFNGVCPKSAPVRQYDITAVLAEDVLPAAEGVTIQDLFPGSHDGRSPEGPGTLVYNSRADAVAGTVEARGGVGPLHDPTAILYVRTDDLEADDYNDSRCWRMERKAKYDPTLPTCPVKLKDNVPVEPVVIRANAGECIEVTLRNKLLQQARTNDVNAYPVYNGLGKPVFEDEGEQKLLEKGLYADWDGDGNPDDNGDGVIDQYDHPVPYADVSFDRMPDLATGNATTAMVRRDDVTNDAVQGMSSFQTNLMVPSACVGLHPALVEYDVTRDDGTAVGQNNWSLNVVCPNATQNPTYRWYAGYVEPKLVSVGATSKKFEYVPTPIEFGGFNIMPADKVEQGQKGLLGAGVINPPGSIWTPDPGTRMGGEANVPDTTAGTAYSFHGYTIVAQKGASMFYADSYPVENLLGEGNFGVAEDPQDMGQMAINYGTEPLWFRFGVNPTDDAGLMTINAGNAYSNSLVGGDPQTGVYTVPAGAPYRMHVLMPFGPGRGSTFDMHGAYWQRDPYVCPGSADGLAGKCDMGNGHAGANGTGEVGSQYLAGIPSIGWMKENPMGFGLGGIESWFPGEHYEVVMPSAGGGNKVPGDYLFRDHMGHGNAQGLWGIVRVEPTSSTTTSGGGGGSTCKRKKCR